MWLLNIYLQIRLQLDETFTGQIKRLLRSWWPGWVFRRCCAGFNYLQGQSSPKKQLVVAWRGYRSIITSSRSTNVSRSSPEALITDNNRHHLHIGLCSNGVQGYTHTHVPPAAAGLLTSRPGHRNKMAHGRFVHVSLLAGAALWQVWPPHSFWFSTAALEECEVCCCRALH